MKVNRTPEMILGIIALVLQFLVILLVVPIFLFFNFQAPELLSPKYEAWYAWFSIAVHIIGFILGIIALVKMRRNPKGTGLTLLISGSVMVFLTLGATLIQLVLFIITGIMCIFIQPVKKEMIV